jgi:hypothetical protein
MAHLSSPFALLPIVDAEFSSGKQQKGGGDDSVFP